ncbi:helix-turn-helix transcriptional regulator [Salinarimonas soli]|uniref:Helix-turn-helix transcriptional regulator n=1 Tax=Salinarimonas soli TaxID=1638099 RepID=A0A5B2VAP2_9HYPH|nr:helix-turn-helix transcriptional regulator [Salinarimonas soli]KAA2236054.1 helix-turn-helix transcriptional regulator [Salinarimonas soli]
MKADEAFSGLIGRIYDCALDNALWPEALGEITAAVNGRMADISVFDPLKGTGHFTACHNWPDDLRERALANFAISPAASSLLTAPLMEPLCTSREFDIEAFHNSRYWQLCFAGRGYYDYLVTGLTRDMSRAAVWGVMGGEERRAFQDEDLDLARLLSPHIRRAIGISGLLGYRRIEAGALRAALDALSAAAFILDPAGRIRFANAAAQRELEAGGLVREMKGRLVGQTPEALRLLGEIAGPGGPRRQRGRDAILTDPLGRALHATWASLEAVGDEIGSPILLLLRARDAELRTPLAAAHSLFHLTTGETQVLAQVLQGLSLTEAAGVLGVARSTAKSHLDAIYRKTNTNKQAELVQVVMGLASPLT